MLEYRVKNPNFKNMLEKPATDKEYHAGILYLTQAIFVISIMADSDNRTDVPGEEQGENKNKKNASMLKQFLFQNPSTNLFRLCHFAFHLYRPNAHAYSFLLDNLKLMHYFLEMIYEHSRGKIITIRKKKPEGRGGATTGGKKRRQREQSEDEEEQDGEFDPNAPEKDEGENQANAAEYGSEDDEVEERYENRQFNFNQEFSILVDY
jgi:hypothetical protein